MGKFISYLMTRRRSTNRENAKLTHAKKVKKPILLCSTLSWVSRVLVSG